VTEVPRLLRHIVLFSYQEGTSEAQKAEVARRFGDLPGQTGVIHQFEWGRNNSPEGLARGFEDCFLVTFLGEAQRATYLPHPAHQAFVAFLGGLVKDSLVFDYWT